MFKSGYVRLFLCICLSIFVSAAHSQVENTSKMNTGTFYHAYWYEPGIEHGNPAFNSRFRVNSPEVVLHPTFGKRSEVKGNGMMQILIEEDLSLLDGAELYLEIWGGHPHTANKRVTINGRSTYMLPEVGTAAGHCTHMYPTIPIKITDLVNGYNVLQFACDQGESFWGHFIVDEACLRFKLKPEHPALQVDELKDFESKVIFDFHRNLNVLIIDVKENGFDTIKSSFIQAYYEGYDENGDGIMHDWHGFTKNRIPMGNIVYSDEGSAGIYLVGFTDNILPQRNIPVRAWVEFNHSNKLLYLTEETIIPFLGECDYLFSSKDLPVPFWSRAGNLKTCTINIDVNPEQIESAQLHCVVWDGGKGNVEEYFKLNGHFVKVAGDGKHDVIYSKIPIDPSILKEGVNTIELLSDTEHHGIEVLLPGPAIAVKLKSE